jgi:mRNA interferase RelE/StbE
VKAIIFTRQAAKDFDALPEPAQKQVMESLSSYAITGHGDVKALIGQEGCRLRIGRYRVIFDQDATTILAIYIGKRETTTYR